MGKNVNVKEVKSLEAGLDSLTEYRVSVKIAGKSTQCFQIPAGARYLERVILPR